jgi:drug/metabolite transporter (DMT)-like permease
VSDSASRAATPPPANDLRGGVYLIIAVLCFTAAFSIIKQLTLELSEPVIGLFRSLFALVFFLPMLVQKGVSFFKTSRPIGHIWRSVFGYGSFLFFVYAVARLPLGDAVALSFTSPFWSILIGAAVFGDKLTWRLGLAVAVGFGGVLLIAQPSAEAGLGVGAIIAIVSAIGTSLAMMMVKQLSGSEPPDRVAFYFMFVSAWIALVPAAFDWTTPTVDHLPRLAFIGGLFFVGQTFLSRAYMYGTFSRMAPLDFVRLPAALTLGYLIFGEVPAVIALVGMALIVVASLDILLGGRR